MSSFFNVLSILTYFKDDKRSYTGVVELYESTSRGLSNSQLLIPPIRTTYRRPLPHPIHSRTPHQHPHPTHTTPAHSPPHTHTPLAHISSTHSPTHTRPSTHSHIPHPLTHPLTNRTDWPEIRAHNAGCDQRGGSAPLHTV